MQFSRLLLNLRESNAKDLEAHYPSEDVDTRVEFHAMSKVRVRTTVRSEEV